MRHSLCFSFFFFNDTATTEIYTLSLHDALPIYPQQPNQANEVGRQRQAIGPRHSDARGFSCNADETHDRAVPHDVYFGDRKSTRLNSSHPSISYAVFCLKKKKKKKIQLITYITI